ncbi:MAG: DNA-processing protein DprA [candidate division WOR-3 bacterium]|nr:DNA-processing protein DprA [candidate division WOR-3 bacterium]
MKKILLNNKEILDEESFINKLKEKRELSNEEIARSKEFDLKRQLKVLLYDKISIITFEDENYPERFKNLEDAPPILFCKGKLLSEDSNAVGIVGTRRATQYGKIIARRLARKLSSLGITIISGLARGIDTQAHLGALEGGGRTIGVMGTGIDLLYPPGNKNLAQKIVEDGALITELPPNSPPLAYHFPARNRIISGLSKAIIAIQAPLKSGVFSTVSWALEYGRDVYALPGDITIEASKGTNKLLKMGAIPFTGYKDILENTDLKIQEKGIRKEKKVKDLIEDEKKVYNLLNLEPKSAERLAHEADLKPQHLLAVLVLLEMKGLAREVGGKRYIREEE